MSDTVDTSGLESHANTFVERAPDGLSNMAKVYQSALAKRIGFGAPLRDGALRGALVIGGKGNISELSITAGGVDIIYGIDGNLIPYARIQDQGGVIKPVHAKALAVPLTDAARAAVKAAGGHVRGLPVFLMPGTNVLANKDTGQPWFVLKQSVTIKGSHYFEDGVAVANNADLPIALRQGEVDLAALWNTI